MHPSSDAMETVVIVILVLLIARRIKGRKIDGWHQPIAITIMLSYGSGLIAAAATSHPAALTGGDLLFLAVGAALSLILGCARGATVHIYDRNGDAYARYRVATVILWLVTFALRLIADANAPHFNAARSINEASVVAMFALSLAGETLVVRSRSAHSERPKRAHPTAPEEAS